VTDTSFVVLDSNHVYNNYQAIGVADSPASWGFPWNVLVVENVTVSNNTLESNEWGITVNNDARNITILYNIMDMATHLPAMSILIITTL